MPRQYSVIIPSKSHQNLSVSLRVLVKSILGSSIPPLAKIVVVDDGLGVRYFASEVTYVDGCKPFCFARNVNIGAAVYPDTDIVIMNDDAILQTPDGLRQMVQIMQGQHLYQVVSTAVNGACCNPRLLITKYPHTNPLDLIVDAGRMVPFICVAIKREVWDELGGLDERFTAYGFEDDDFCRSVRHAGGRIGMYKKAAVEHDSLPSTFRSSGYADLAPNKAQYIKKWGDHEGI